MSWTSGATFIIWRWQNYRLIPSTLVHCTLNQLNIEEREWAWEKEKRGKVGESDSGKKNESLHRKVNVLTNRTSALFDVYIIRDQRQRNWCDDSENCSISIYRSWRIIQIECNFWDQAIIFTNHHLQLKLIQLRMCLECDWKNSIAMICSVRLVIALNVFRFVFHW